MMIQIISIVLLVSCGLVASQTEHIMDPGLYTFSGNQCAGDRAWYFRSDYLWNDTETFFDSRCNAFYELPTSAVPGLTKGNQTNINKALIPALPMVTGGNPTYPSSAAVVDMNTPCRAAIWQPFVIDTVGSTATLSLYLWVRSNSNIQQLLDPNSAVYTSVLLQYLREPDGLLSTTGEFIPVKEETNLVRIDIILPDGSGSFYDRAFSVDTTHIAGQVDIPGFTDGYVTPASGTNSQWLRIETDISDIVSVPGTYALRISSAQSRVGVSWGISDVHLTTTGGTKKRNARQMREEFRPMKEESEKIVGKVQHSSGKVLKRK